MYVDAGLHDHTLCSCIKHTSVHTYNTHAYIHHARSYARSYARSSFQGSPPFQFTNVMEHIPEHRCSIIGLIISFRPPPLSTTPVYAHTLHVHVFGWMYMCIYMHIYVYSNDAYSNIIHRITVSTGIIHFAGLTGMSRAKSENSKSKISCAMTVTNCFFCCQLERVSSNRTRARTYTHACTHTTM